MSSGFRPLFLERCKICAHSAIRGVSMRTFPALRSSFMCGFCRFFSQAYRLVSPSGRGFLSAVLVVIFILTVIVAIRGSQITLIPNGTFFLNPTGASETYSTAGGGIDLTGPFFQSMGSNGRACSTCHQPSDAMSVSAASIQQRFAVTQGLDPIFRTIDGSNCN